MLILYDKRQVFRFYKISTISICRATCVQILQSMKIKCLHEITQDDDQLLLYIVEWQYIIDPTYEQLFLCKTNEFAGPYARRNDSNIHSDESRVQS